MPSSSCLSRIYKTFALGGKAKRHEDLSWSRRKTKKQLVTQLGLIAFRLLCHLWVPGGKLCSARSFTLILSGISIRLCPKHEGLQKGKVLSPTSCSVVIYLCLPDLQHFLCSLQCSIGLIRPLGLRVIAAQRDETCCNNSHLGWTAHAKQHCLDTAFLKSATLSYQTLWKWSMAPGTHPQWPGRRMALKKVVLAISWAPMGEVAKTSV